jgi:glycosyltransferase involved in cell wall biosynthesis
LLRRLMQPPFNKEHKLVLPFDRGGVMTFEASDSGRLCAQPLVSVVMLTYAHEAYLAKAVEGVLAQRADFGLELIIGEDCSPDRTRELALRYQRDHPAVVRVVSSETNVGARRNAFRCEQLCRGKYLAYCEGDDYWHDPRKLQMQVGHLQDHPQCGLVYTNADTWHILSGRRTPMAIPYRPELCDSDDPFVQQLAGVRIIWPLTVCVRKALLDDITRECPEITDARPPMGDTQRYLEIAHRSGIDYLPVSTATRNLLPESATQSQDLARKARFVAAGGDMTLHYLEKYPVPERYDRQVRRWVHLRNLEYAYHLRDAARAREAAGALRGRQIRLPLRHRLYLLGAVNRPANRVVKAVLAALGWMASARRALHPRAVAPPG